MFSSRAGLTFLAIIPALFLLLHRYNTSTAHLDHALNIPRETPIHSQDEPIQRICDAYKSLHKLDAAYSTHPPLFHDLLHIPRHAPQSSESDRQEFGRILIKGLSDRVQQYYDVRGVQSDAEWQMTERKIAVWNRVATVLINPEVRDVYNKLVLGPVIRGQSVGSRVNKVCEGRWTTKGLAQGNLLEG